MGDKRDYLAPGQKLYFENGVCIELDEVVGGGGTALTYYGRELIEDQEPVRVLLKELYPCGADFGRDAEGRILVQTLESERVYEALVDSLYDEQELGNQIVQKKIVGLYPMKQVLREQNTGNYYGLFYQCPPSVTLRALVEKAGSQMSLWGKLKLIQALCRLVQSMHEHGGYCHNDISGGNVLILSNALALSQCDCLDWSIVERELKVGLIDFACTAKLNRRGEGMLRDLNEPMQFHTDGFSAPELYEANVRHITVKADVYSVAACLWYLLTEEVLETEDGYPVLGQREWRFLEKCLRKHELCSLSGDVRIAFGKNPNLVPEDVIDKIVRLLEHGLAENWNRFRNMEILEDRLQEILDLIEGSSISDSILDHRLREAFHAEREKLRNRYEIRRNLLPVAVRSGAKEEQPLLDLFLSGTSVYAIGQGGAGKTTTMFQAAETLYKNDGDVIPVYLELNRLPVWKSESGVDPKTYWLGDDGRPMFLEQYLAGVYYGCHGKLTDRNDLAAGALCRQIERQNPDGKKYLILMDGLNEMAFSDHEEKQAFAAAVNWYLQYGANLSLVLTSRYDEGTIDADKIPRVQVTGLTEASVEVCLREEVDTGHMTTGEYEKLMGIDHNSNLWKCLKLPLFLSMYCRIEDKRKIQSAGEILQAYFRGKEKALDGSREYSEVAISEEKYVGVQFGEGISMEHARRLIIDLLLPSLGYSMMYLQVFFLEKKAAERMMNRYLDEKCLPSVVKRHGYTFDVEQALKIMKEVGSEKILSFICENMGILAQESSGSYFFPHQYYRDYFAANKLIRMFCEVSELFARDKVNDEESFLIEDMIDYFAARKIPESVLMLCGECLGVHRTVPEYQAGGWKIPESWDSLVDSMLEFGRIPNKKDTDLRAWQANIKYRFNRNALYFEFNLFNMICLCRKRGNRADLSGIDFHGISLEKCPVEHVIFSHPQGKNGIYADLRDTGYKAALRRNRREPSFRFFGEGLRNDDNEERVFLHPEGNWALVMEKKEEFSSLSNVSEFKTHLEEREVLGDEVRPIGYWDKINAIDYREDGRFLAIVETVTNVSTYMMEESRLFEKIDRNEVGPIENVYFYDRKEGKTYRSRMSPVAIESVGKCVFTNILCCRWIKDLFVILHATKEHRLVHTVVRLEDGQLTQNHTVIDLDYSICHGEHYILDEERILIYYQTHGVIYQTQTRQVLGIPVKTEWRYCTADPAKGCIYVFTRSGSVERIDIQSGESSVIREAEIFATIEHLKIHKDIIYFIEGDHLYQTDHTFQEIRFIRKLPEEEFFSENRMLSVGENHAVTDSSMVFRISDGMVVRRWDNYEEICFHPRRFWVHPKNDSDRISILDQGNKVLYHLGLAEDRSLTCTGYRFIELNDEYVYAIYVDSEQGLLLTCEENRICYYDLNSGKKLERISEINLSPYSIESAAFAPGGKSLEIRAVHNRICELKVLSEERFFHLNCQDGMYSERSVFEEHRRIVRYQFAFEDIESGYDSGNRSPVFKHDMDWYVAKSELKDYLDSGYNSSLRSLFPKKLVSFIEHFDMSMPSEIELFDHGKNRCVARIEGCFYWDAAKKRWYRFQGKSGEIDNWAYCDQDVQDTYPFEGGFIKMENGKIKRYVEDHKQKIMEQWIWDPGSVKYTLGCPGTESIQYQSLRSMEEDVSDEW